MRCTLLAADPITKPKAEMMSYRGKAVDWLVSSESSPTTEWMAPVMP